MASDVDALAGPAGGVKRARTGPAQYSSTSEVTLPPRVVGFKQAEWIETSQSRQGKQFNRTLKQLLTLEAQRDKEHLPQQQQPQQQQKQPQQQHASQPQPQVKLAFLLEEDNRDRGKEGKAATSTSTAADEIRDLAASLPTPSYSSIQAGPTHYPVKKFCDITGVEAPYTDPASKLLYAHPSLYPRIRHMPEHVVAQFLAARTHLSVKKTTR